MNQIHLVAWQVPHAHPLSRLLLVLLELWNLLTVVESQHSSVKQLVVFLEETFVCLAEMAVIEPICEVGPYGWQGLLPTDVITCIKEHPRFIE